LARMRGGGTVPPTISNLIKEATLMMTMRTKLLAAALFVGTLAAVLIPLANAQSPVGNDPVSGSRGNSGVPPRNDSPNAIPAPTRQHWEYKFVPSGSPANELQQSFADMGGDGWEFCGTYQFKEGTTPASQATLIFKRLKASGNPMGVLKAANPEPAAGEGGWILKKINLKDADVADIAKVLTPVFKNATITADLRTNTLVIRADTKTLDEMAPLIEKLDRPAKK
jgi:hypothetical protein